MGQIVNIIHGKDAFDHMATACLAIDWGLGQGCWVEHDDGHCPNTISTIITYQDDSGETHHIGLCEHHYQEAQASGRFSYRVSHPDT